MRRLDHSMIFLFIAGAYTSVACVALNGQARFAVLGVIWTGAVTGFIIRQTFLDVPKWISASIYLGLGWTAMLVRTQLVEGLGPEGTVWIAWSGATYTVGALMYACHWPNPVPGFFGYHECFHLSTVVGAALHYYMLVAHALPRSNLA